jgi:hypothetical protein
VSRNAHAPGSFVLNFCLLPSLSLRVTRRRARHSLTTSGREASLETQQLVLDPQLHFLALRSLAVAQAVNFER